MSAHTLSGVFAAAITPIKKDNSLDIDAFPGYLDFLAERGCHGALLLGTTGEGPSFSVEERLSIYQEARKYLDLNPDFHLFVGAGTPSLTETINLTRSAFDLGLDGVVVLPPYYYRNASDEGLFSWYKEIIDKAVPSDGLLFGYHIPAVSGVALSLELLERLGESFPGRFAGLKDSSGIQEQAQLLGERFANTLAIFNGSDRLFSIALKAGAAGAITAAANLISPALRKLWDLHQQGEHDPETQKQIDLVRTAMDRYPPAPPLLKALLSRFFGFPHWKVRPPLTPLSPDLEERAASEILPLMTDLALLPTIRR